MLIGFDGNDLEAVFNILKRGEKLYYKSEEDNNLYQVLSIKKDKEERIISYIDNRKTESIQTKPYKKTKFYVEYEVIAEYKNMKKLKLIFLSPDLLKEKRVFLADTDNPKSEIPVKSIEVFTEDDVDIILYDGTKLNRSIYGTTFIIKEKEEEEEESYWDVEDEFGNCWEDDEEW